MTEARATRSAGRPLSKDLDCAVLEATLDALAEVGFEALSVASVARRARSTTPAVYRRFAGKTELVVAAVEHELTRLPPAPPELGDLRRELIAWTQNIADALTPRRARILVALMLAAPTAPEPARRLAAELDRRGSAEWTTLTERAIRRGDLAGHPDFTLISRIPAAMITHLALRGETPPDAALIEQLVDAVLLPALRATTTHA